MLCVCVLGDRTQQSGDTINEHIHGSETLHTVDCSVKDKSFFVPDKQ